MIIKFSRITTIAAKHAATSAQTFGTIGKTKDCLIKRNCI